MNFQEKIKIQKKIIKFYLSYFLKKDQKYSIKILKISLFIAIPIIIMLQYIEIIGATIILKNCQSLPHEIIKTILVDGIFLINTMICNTLIFYVINSDQKNPIFTFLTLSCCSIELYEGEKILSSSFHIFLTPNILKIILLGNLLCSCILSIEKFKSQIKFTKEDIKKNFENHFSFHEKVQIFKKNTHS